MLWGPNSKGGQGGAEGPVGSRGPSGWFDDYSDNS